MNACVGACVRVCLSVCLSGSVSVCLSAFLNPQNCHFPVSVTPAPLPLPKQQQRCISAVFRTTIEMCDGRGGRGLLGTAPPDHESYRRPSVNVENLAILVLSETSLVRRQETCTLLYGIFADR